MTAKLKVPAGSPVPPAYTREVERQIDASRELEVFTVATLPSAAAPYRWIHVSDETGGPAAAINNGTNWLRFPDGATVS